MVDLKERIVRLPDGRIVFDGPEEIKEFSDGRWVEPSRSITGGMLWDATVLSEKELSELKIKL